MTTKRILVCTALILCLLGGIAAERGVGVADRVISSLPQVDATVAELSRLSEFLSVSRLGEAPEFILNDLATDGLPLAENALVALSERMLDANSADEQVVSIIVDIAGDQPDGKSLFLGNIVSSCIMFGVEYGRFVAMQEGIVAPNEVDRLVTAYGSASLEGLLVFLRALPCPEEAENEADSGEADDGEFDAAKRQLDD